jgi:Lambda phage tail tube protein, TTP
MSVPLVGLGTTCEFASVLAPTVFTVITGVTSAAFSGDKVSTEKTTSMLTANGVDTYISGTQEPGTCDIKALYQPGDAAQVALEAARLAGVAIPFKIVYPLSIGSASFSGIVESATRSFPLDKVCQIDYKIKISGPVVTV